MHDPQRVGQERARSQAAHTDRGGEDPRRERDDCTRRGSPYRGAWLGSDYTAFLDHLKSRRSTSGSAATDGGGIYHSVYDSFYWFTHFSDGTFVHSAALSQSIGTALLRLANADVLPFEFQAPRMRCASMSRRLRNSRRRTLPVVGTRRPHSRSGRQ